MTDFAYYVQRFPMLDTGIGQSLGFESDVAFLDHQRAEEAKLDPEVRGALKAVRQETVRTMLYGV